MKPKKAKLTQEEKEIESYIASIDPQPISEEEKQQWQKWAKDFLEKTKSITLRVKESDLQKIKVKAIENGLPYQTLISSVLHQYVNDKLAVKYADKLKNKKNTDTN